MRRRERPQDEVDAERLRMLRDSLWMAERMAFVVVGDQLAGRQERVEMLRVEIAELEGRDA